MHKWMFAMSMRYASRYLELFSSYYNNRMEKRIIRLVDQYVFEPRKVLILVILYWRGSNREKRRTDIGKRENPSWWVGENCVNWMLIIIFWRTHQNTIEEEVAKKVILSCKKTIKIFPLVRSGCEISNISDMGQTNWHLKGRMKGSEPLYFWPHYRSGSFKIFLCILKTSTVSDFNRRNVMFRTALLYLLFAAYVKGELNWALNR